MNTGKGINGPILPQSYTFVPPVGRNLVTQPPYKDVQPMTEGSVIEETTHEEAWMSAVGLHDTLYTDSVTDSTQVVWSAYHAARSDVVGKPEKNIEALLPLFHEKASPEMIQHGMKIVKDITEHLNPHQVPLIVVDQSHMTLPRKYNGHSQAHMEKTSLLLC